jgi:hypothetical protein
MPPPERQNARNAIEVMNHTRFQLILRRPIGAIAHRLCRLIWKILHQGSRYEERGPAINKRRTQARAAKMIRELRSLGYRVELILSQPGSPA